MEIKKLTIFRVVNVGEDISFDYAESRVAKRRQYGR